MATTKPKKAPKKRELDLNRVLSAVDNKNYNFYDNLTEAELKEFSPFVLMRFVSNVDSRDRDIQEWFVEMTNELVNKNHWDLSMKNCTGCSTPQWAPALRVFIHTCQHLKKS